MSAKPMDRSRARLGDVSSSSPSASFSLAQMRSELLARLVVHDPATQVVRHLFMVLQELGKSGWPAVDALPPQVLARAVAEAEMQQDEDPSPVLQALLDRLRQASDAAQPAPELVLLLDDAQWEMTAVPEVSETSYDEYELMERSWIGTVPSGLEVPAPTR